MLCVHSFLPNGIFFWVLGRSRPTNTNRKKGKPTPFLPKRTETMMMQQQFLPNFASASFQGVRSSPLRHFLSAQTLKFHLPSSFPEEAIPETQFVQRGKRERKRERMAVTYNQLSSPPYLSLLLFGPRPGGGNKKRKEKERLTAGAPRGDALWMEKRGKGYGEKEIR